MSQDEFEQRLHPHLDNRLSPEHLSARNSPVFLF